MSIDTATRAGVTRGHGTLETLLSRLRARKANQLIPNALRRGRLLDIGCGSFPYFLTNTQFQHKFAIDQFTPAHVPHGIEWHMLDLNHAPHLPFEDGYLSVITLLAVAEHIRPASLTLVLREAYRTLQPGGRVILTTPAHWTDGLLRWMSRQGLVSLEEINEHVYGYSLPQLAWQFGAAGFEMQRINLGTFELGMNLWATAER